MFPAAQIPVGISTKDCLSWSSDGELAIAAGEYVYLLIPSQHKSKPWKHIRIQISLFTVEEWPWPVQASFKDMSIGEEQARATVIALAWSPGGIAEYRRSVLAVLTSNLLLSLWAPVGDVADPEKWERTIIINWALAPSIPMTKDEHRLAHRIRSMAWAPTCPDHVDRITPFSRRKWGIHLLAITDDVNGIYILDVSSPHKDASSSWDTEVLLYKKVPSYLNISKRPSLLNIELSSRFFLDRIEFGTWMTADTIHVTYFASGLVHRKALTISLSSPLMVTLHGEAIDLSPSSTLAPDLPEKTTFAAQIDDQKENYDNQNSLGGHVTAQTWGSASFDGLYATCISLHPSDAIEYLDPFDGTAIILFEKGEEMSHDLDPDIFPWQKSPEVDETRVHIVILDVILNDQSLHSVALSGFDFRLLYAAMCATVLAHDEVWQKRLRSVENLVNFLQSKANIDLGEELAMVRSCQNNPQASFRDRSDLVRKTTKARGQMTTEGSGIPPLLDKCPCCSDDLPRAIAFESMTEAYCPQQHPFSKFLLSTSLPLSIKILKFLAHLSNSSMFPHIPANT